MRLILSASSSSTTDTNIVVENYIDCCLMLLNNCILLTSPSPYLVCTRVFQLTSVKISKARVYVNSNVSASGVDGARKRDNSVGDDIATNNNNSSGNNEENMVVVITLLDSSIQKPLKFACANNGICRIYIHNWFTVCYLS